MDALIRPLPTRKDSDYVFQQAAHVTFAGFRTGWDNENLMNVTADSLTVSG